MVTGSRNGIIARSSRADLLDRAARARFARSASNRGRPVSFSAIHALGERARSGSRRGSSSSRARVASSTTRGPADVVAVLGGVADRVAHVVEAAAVHEIDDQLQLVQALEVGDLRLIAGLDQRLEAGLDQRADAAAQDRLLAEEIGLGLLGERRLEDAGARGADALGVRQRERARLAASRPGGRRTAPARRRPPGRSRARDGRAPSARPCATSTSGAAARSCRSGC